MMIRKQRQAHVRRAMAAGCRRRPGPSEPIAVAQESEPVLGHEPEAEPGSAVALRNAEQARVTVAGDA
jgi:hypothetical protein